MLILDADAASVLAKGNLIEPTLELFSGHTVAITPKIEEELEKPLEYGFTYPNRVFDNVETVSPTREEREQYRQWYQEMTVDKGELEATAVAEARNAIFFTMDEAAARFANQHGVQTLAFDTLAELLLENNLLTQEELRDAVQQIEQRDNRDLNLDDLPAS